MKDQFWCVALGGHALKAVGPIVVLKGDLRRISLQCIRCGTLRFDKWKPNGLKGAANSYIRPKDYQELLDNHDRQGVRSLILSEGRTVNETNNPSLRLVPRAKQTKRRRAARTYKRPRDKRRSGR